jgi:hypothetical protein
MNSNLGCATITASFLLALPVYGGVHSAVPLAKAPAISNSIAELRRNTQALLDAIAPGDVAVWDKLVDAEALFVDENDVVRTKAQMLAELKPLGAGLAGNIAIDEFKVALHANVAVVTHEDNEYLNYHGQVLRSRFRNADTWLYETAGWREIGSQTLAVLKDPPSIHINDAALCGFNGRYAMTAEIIATLECVNGALVMKREGRADRTFLPETRDVFFEPGQPRTRRIFQYNAQDQVTGFVDRREARDIAWNRIESPDL